MNIQSFGIFYGIILSCRTGKVKSILSRTSFYTGTYSYQFGHLLSSQGIWAHVDTSSSVKYQMKAEAVPFPKHHQAWDGDIMRRRTISAKLGQQCKSVKNWSRFVICQSSANISRCTYTSYY